MYGEVSGKGHCAAIIIYAMCTDCGVKRSQSGQCGTVKFAHSGILSLVGYNSLTRQIIFLCKRKDSHRSGIPPLRESKKNHIVIIHIINMIHQLRAEAHWRMSLHPLHHNLPNHRQNHNGKGQTEPLRPYPLHLYYPPM